MTPFGAILKRAVEAIPGAVGGSFADADGEMVDSFTARPATGLSFDAHDWAVLTAHYGVLLGHLESLVGTWHYGGPEYFVAQHAKLDVVVHTVDAGYYTLLAMQRASERTEQSDHEHSAQDQANEESARLIAAIKRAREAALALKKEMS